MRVASMLAIASAILAPARGQTYIGASACGRCHPAEFRQQSASDHANSLYPANQHPLAAQFVPRVPLRRDPSYEFRFALERRGLLVRIASADRAIVLPIEWAFGAGSQAVTFVTRLRNNNYLEHYFSFYTKTHEMGITPGQDATGARDLMDAAGKEHQTLDIAECFYCHSTGPVQITGGDVRPSENGVRCEACHGPGGEHQRTQGKVPFRNPRDLAASELNDACGKCHRLPVSNTAAFDFDSPWNVRFEPAYLSQSACFLKSAGKLSCLSCHSGHESSKRAPDYYNSVCVSCHASIHTAASMDNCIGCHMPRTSPRGPLQFTDHWIGIYQPGRLKPEIHR
jgi:hypothetical protein